MTDGTLNGGRFSCFNIVSSNPPLISIAIQRKKPAQKDTARNILEQEEFVVQLVDMDNVNQVNQTAASLPSNQSEIKLANLTPVTSNSVSVPGVLEAKGRFECILEKHIELGKDGEVHTDLIIGKVIYYHLDKDIYEAGDINTEKLASVSRMAGNDYAKLGEAFSIRRPK